MLVAEKLTHHEGDDDTEDVLRVVEEIRRLVEVVVDADEIDEGCHSH